MSMYKILENLINNTYYRSKEEVEQKLNVFFAFNVLTQEQYTQLMQLTEEKYKENVVENSKAEEVTTE